MNLIIPHYGRGGGAGKYIDFIYKSMSNVTDTRFAGYYSNQYVGKIFPTSRILDFTFNALTIPLYSGVKTRNIIFYIFRFLFLFPFFYIFSYNFPKKTASFSSLILTSTIQLPLILLNFKILRKTKKIIFIQENIILDGLVGFICIFLLKRFDVVVAINSYEQKRLASKGIKTTLVRNNFDFEVSELENNDINSYDAVYVGGELEIKGFLVVIDLFKKLSIKKRLNILLLGEYSKRGRKYIEKANKLAKNDSKLFLIGRVESCNEYYLKSKFLLLPIKSAHFCRPAIEVGLLRKTFIVTDLTGLSDFSIPNYNCLTFKPGDTNSFIEVFEKLLDDKLRNELERNNFNFSSKYIADSNIQEFLSKFEINK